MEKIVAIGAQSCGVENFPVVVVVPQPYRNDPDQQPDANGATTV